MTPREVNVLLTQAALLDARLRRDPEERAAMSTAWAQVLHEIPLKVALAALAVHYREETRTLMPADVVAFAAEHAAGGRTRPADGRAWLEARGVDPDAFQELLDAGETPTRALRELGAVQS